MAVGNDANDPKNNGRWAGMIGFLKQKKKRLIRVIILFYAVIICLLKQTRLIRVIIATAVLIYTITQIVGLESDDIALIAILSGIAGSAATFLFSSASGKND